MAMIVVIDTYGVSVGKTKNSIRISQPTPDGTKVHKKVPVLKIDCLVINKGVYVSFDAAMLLATHGKPIYYTDRGRPVAALTPFYNHGTVITRREQFLAYQDSRGLFLGKQFVTAALLNKEHLLRSLAKTRQQTNPALSQTLLLHADTIHHGLNKLESLTAPTIASARNELMGIEGEATRTYYQALTTLLPPELGFEGRERRPPTDPVNAVLSYGYVILASDLTLDLAIAGLEPYAGYLHADRSGRTSLSLDLAEEFRQPLIDRMVLNLFVRYQLTADHFDTEPGSSRTLLNKAGKRVFFEALTDRKKKKVIDPVTKELVPLGNMLLRQARNIVRYLLGKDAQYTPYIPAEL